eukprot:scaffold188657_cov29-Prasinocladus_malaysianus.AAC.1
MEAKVTLSHTVDQLKELPTVWLSMLISGNWASAAQGEHSVALTAAAVAALAKHGIRGVTAHSTRSANFAPGKIVRDAPTFEWTLNPRPREADAEQP